MSAAENKLNLLQMIIESEDNTFIDRLTRIARSLKKSKSHDWADDLPAHVIDELELSIKEVNNGEEGIPHSKMLEEAKKSFPELNL